MTLQQLQYIIALDTHRHFVRAAESCFVAQPTLTLQVKKLEEEINAVIFDRSEHPLIPTPMGEKFILKARQILREVDNLKEMVNQDRNQLEGTFKVGIIPTLAPYLLPLFVKTFADEHPKVLLDIKEAQSDQIMAGVLDGTMDFGIMVTPLNETYIREIPMFYEPFLLYANVHHALLRKDKIKANNIKEKGLWLLDKGHCFRNQVLNICDKAHLLSASQNILFESGAIETLKNIIQNVSGYTLIPEMAVNKQTDSKFVRRFEEPQPAREVSIVAHTSFTKELLLTHLRKTILSNVPDRFRKNERFITVNWR